MIRVLLAGHRGKVGAALEPALAAAEDVDYVGGVGRGDDLAAALREKQPQVLVDFTHPGAGLENALAAHPKLSVAAATRLAARYATNVSAVLRLIGRGDLPEELVRRLAGQSTRPLVAAAARTELQRRGSPLPPLRSPQRGGKSLTGHAR